MITISIAEGPHFLDAASLTPQADGSRPPAPQDAPLIRGAGLSGALGT